MLIKPKNAQVEKGSSPVNSISVGVTWVDGRIIFKEEDQNKKWYQFYYGICHYSRHIFAITPLDYPKVTMITTIMVSDTQSYCERSYTCLHKKCRHNRLDKGLFLAEFKDCGAFTLGLPRTFNDENPFWFNIPPYPTLWDKLIIPIDGGILKYDEYKAAGIIV